MATFIFVGERPSATARRRQWTWRHGRLAARTLFDALRAAGLEPLAQRYTNLFDDGMDVKYAVVWRLRREVRAGCVIVALGKRVSIALERAGIGHTPMVHPAARGVIRKRERYHEHVRACLGQ